mgnify:CR=1 FL=1
MIGQRFDRLVVVSLDQVVAFHRPTAVCRCDCGNVRTVTINNLKNGGSRSCGCRRNERLKQRSVTHGASEWPEYAVWNTMIARCENPKHERYPRYGGRGITVCDEWRSSFERFISDMGRRPSPSHSIDRKDNDGHYAPDNCRWATPREQAANTSQKRLLTLNGRTQRLCEWSAETGIRSQLLITRMGRLGWSVEKALTTPVQSRSGASA